MELICFYELSGLAQIVVLIGVVAGAVLFMLGIVLAFLPAAWKGKASGKYDKISAALPGPLACIVLGFVLIAADVWWLWKAFPADRISFSQKRWTLNEVKERLERVSKIRIDLKG